ncbi:MAG: hypothetical protein AAF620_00310 [Bacteroidota bacterium]
MKVMHLLPAVYAEELHDISLEEEEGMYTERRNEEEQLHFRNLYFNMDQVETFFARNDSLTDITMVSGTQYVVQLDEGSFRMLMEEYAGREIIE